MTTQVSKVTQISEKRRELRGHISETGEIVRFDAIRKRADDDGEGPRAA